MPASITPYSVTLFCACAAPAVPRSASEREVSAKRFIEFSTRMFRFVVAGAENNAALQNLRNEKLKTCLEKKTLFPNRRGGKILQGFCWEDLFYWTRLEEL